METEGVGTDRPSNHDILSVRLWLRCTALVSFPSLEPPLTSLESLQIFYGDGISQPEPRRLRQVGQVMNLSTVRSLSARSTVFSPIARKSVALGSRCPCYRLGASTRAVSARHHVRHRRLPAAWRVGARGSTERGLGREFRRRGFVGEGTGEAQRRNPPGSPRKLRCEDDRRFYSPSFFVHPDLRRMSFDEYPGQGIGPVSVPCVDEGIQHCPSFPLLYFTGPELTALPIPLVLSSAESLEDQKAVHSTRGSLEYQQCHRSSRIEMHHVFPK